MARLKKTERRDQIVEAAAEVFARCGLNGARTREIAEVCGVNEALIYKHFRGKSELFREVLRLVHGQLMASWQKIAEKAPDGKTALLEVFDSQRAVIGGNAKICSGVIHSLSAAASDEKTRSMVTDWFSGQHEFVAALVRRGIEDGSLSLDMHPDLIAWWIKGAGWAAILATSLDPGSAGLSSGAWDAFRALIEHMPGNHA